MPGFCRELTHGTAWQGQDDNPGRATASATDITLALVVPAISSSSGWRDANVTSWPAAARALPAPHL